VRAVAGKPSTPRSARGREEGRLLRGHCPDRIEPTLSELAGLARRGQRCSRSGMIEQSSRVEEDVRETALEAARFLVA
jgi:hypothetical protein